MKYQPFHALFLMLFAALQCIAAEKAEFTFDVKQVGSPDELHLYTQCGFEGQVAQCHFDSGVKQTEYNSAEFFAGRAPFRKTESKDAFGHVSVCHEYLVGTLSVGHSSERDFAIKRCDGQRLHQAVLGVDYFRGKSFTLDFDMKTVTFGTAVTAASEQLFLLVDNYIGLPVTIGTTSFLALFDTGVGKTVVDEVLVKKHKHLFKLLEESDVKTPTGETYKVGLYRMKRFQVGKRVYRDVLVQALPFSAMTNRFGKDVHAILGNNVIFQNNWSFDLVNRRFSRLSRSATP